MDPIDALEPVGAADLVPVPVIDATFAARLEPPAGTWATTTTGYDRYPAILDPVAASIAAAAAAQDLKLFQLSQARLRRR